MKIFSLFLWVSAFAVSLCPGGPVFAANKIYPFDNAYGILADDAEWICKVSPGAYSAYNIEGKARYLPTSFDFFTRTIVWKGNSTPNAACAFDNVKEFLADYAQKFGVIFSNLSVKKLEGNSFVATGSYFDNTSIGKLAFYIKTMNRPRAGHNCYCMFVKITGDLLDERATDHLFQETFDLITPLIQE